MFFSVGLTRIWITSEGNYLVKQYSKRPNVRLCTEDAIESGLGSGPFDRELAICKTNNLKHA